MKKTLSILFLCAIFACTEQVKESDLNKSKIDSVAAKADPVKPEEPWEHEMKMLEKEHAEKLKDFKITMQQKEFNFACYDKCDDGVGISYEEMKKYGLRKPFGIEKKINDDTLIIRFKFISDCCLEYIGDVEKRNDSLLLSYTNISHAPCDCHCYYYYAYSLPMEKYQSKYIFLNEERIK